MSRQHCTGQDVQPLLTHLNDQFQLGPKSLHIDDGVAFPTGES